VDLIELERSLIGDMWTSPALANSLHYLCDACNGRFAGSDDERRAGDYMIEHLRDYGLDDVRAESFAMQGWERGDARLALLGDDGDLSGGARELPCLALAGSPSGVVKAELVDAGAGTPADFERLGDLSSKAVLAGPQGPHRLEKYAQSMAAGAHAFLFANGRPGMLEAAGSIGLDADKIGLPDAAPLPGVGLSLETASFLRRRLAEDGSLHVRVEVEGGPMPVTARNIVAELPGTDPKAGWIVVCGHYDGHDIAQGAQDNATGTAVVLEAARALAPLCAHLTAGLRFVLFSGEEMGMYGSAAYVRDHPGELDQIRAVFNADIVGLAAPLVLMTQNSDTLSAYLRRLPLDEIGARVEDGRLVPYSDHFHFTLAGIASLMAVTSPPPSGGGWAHTAADTLDKLDVRAVREAAVATARLLLRMAAAPKGLPTERESPEAVRDALVEAGLEAPMRARGEWPF
jgi:Iap family predicted aminopeptidase